MNKKYQISDIAVIIPTYNRPEDLEETLISLIPSIKNLNEVIVVDQSSDEKTKRVVKKFRNAKLKYIYSQIPSIAISRNMGVKNLSLKSKIIIFIDDDVTLGKNYFEKILEVFNENPSAKGVGAHRGKPHWGFFENIMKKIFFLEYYEKDKARIVSAYGNTYPKKLNRIIQAQWLPGVNMAYKQEIFKEQQFDGNLLGYTIAEDTDFSYRLYKKYPKSIFITPFAQITHRASTTARYPTKKMSYVNQVDHFYFNYKNLNRNILQKIVFCWSLLGISLLRTFTFLFAPKKANWLKLAFFFESLSYSLKNIENIKKGKLRNF